MIKVSEKDLNTIKKMAERYDMSLVKFARTIITQHKAKKERQFRTSEEEFEIISNKAMKKNMTVMGYCERAVKKYLKGMAKEMADDPAIVKYQIGETRYGMDRNKRITVRINDEEIEETLIEMSEEYHIDIGAILRYCALKF